jgi:hypothetical protein
VALIRHSLSKLKCFEQCPLKYKLRYVDGIQDPSGPAAQRGILMHAVFENHLRGEDVVWPANLKHYEGFSENLKKSGALPEKVLTLDKDWKPVEEEVWYKAILDVLLIKEPEAWIYDWKSGKEYDDHYDQKEIYSVAVFCSFPEVSTVRAIHVYLDHGRNTERVYDRSQMPAMRDRWALRFKKLEDTTEFHPNPNFGCRYCGFSKSKGGPCRF